MGVIGEGQHDVRARVQEFAMQLDYGVRMFQHCFGHVGAGGEIAAALDLEQIALGANDGSCRQPFEQTRSDRRTQRGSLR